MRLSVPLAARLVRRALGRHVAGYCYVASEAIYHLTGGRRAGLTVIGSRRGNGGAHWYLRAANGQRIDVTAGQFRPRLRASEYASARS